MSPLVAPGAPAWRVKLAERLLRLVQLVMPEGYEAVEVQRCRYTIQDRRELDAKMAKNREWSARVNAKS